MFFGGVIVVFVGGGIVVIFGSGFRRFKLLGQLFYARFDAFDFLLEFFRRFPDVQFVVVHGCHLSVLKKRSVRCPRVGL